MLVSKPRTSQRTDEYNLNENKFSIFIVYIKSNTPVTQFVIQWSKSAVENEFRYNKLMRGANWEWNHDLGFNILEVNVLPESSIVQYQANHHRMRKLNKNISNRLVRRTQEKVWISRTHVRMLQWNRLMMCIPVLKSSGDGCGVKFNISASFITYKQTQICKV